MPVAASLPVHSRNDPAQYDDFAGAWWDRRGPFAMLHWIAAARAALIPPADREDALAVDVACGGGLLGPQLAALGYRHVGVDLVASALQVARAHGVSPIQGDAAKLPLRDGAADVVVAGECLEHVPGLRRVVGELCRVLRPGGLLVLDTLAATPLARFLAVTVAERMPGGPPRGLHDPGLFVDRDALVDECARHGVALRLSGLRPAIGPYLAWLLGRRDEGSMTRSRSTAILFQGHGVKRGDVTGGDRP